MTRTTTMTVRLRKSRSDFVAVNVDPDGAYENVSEYVRNREHAEYEGFEQLKAELQRAFAAPDSSYRSLTAADVIARGETPT